MADLPEADRLKSGQFTRRCLLLGGAQAAGLALVGWRLFDLQVIGARRYAPLADENRTNLQILTPKRGRILDVFGRVLADNDELFRVTITPALTKNVAASLRRVARIIPLSDDEIERLVVRMRKLSRNTPTTIASDLSFEQVAKLNLYAPSLPGIKTDFTWRRRYHGGAALSQVVGFVGSVDRFSIDDEALVRHPDVRVGKSGLELAFDADLRGTGGTQKSEVDASGRVVRELETIAPVAGRDVSITLDGELQKRIVDRMQAERRGASAVVLDVMSGEVAVMASVPGFDPEVIARGISDADWAALTSSADNPLLNRAVAGLYAPGSTFVVVTALAALDAGVVSPDERVLCKGRYEYGGQLFRCSNPLGHGAINLHEAIRSSCEVFFCEMSSRLGIWKIASTARAMGMGTASGIGLAEEKAGVVPDPDWKRGNLNAAWFGGETLLAGIGQGYMQATPLQLAMVAGRLARGRSVLPVLRKIATSTNSTAGFAELPFSTAHIETVRNAMVAAVNETGGSADRARLGNGRPLVAGKTGVSEIGVQADAGGRGTEGPKRNNALFIGFAPADAPRYAIATVIERGGEGDAAALLASDILSLVNDRDASNPGRSGADGGYPATYRANAKEAG